MEDALDVLIAERDRLEQAIAVLQRDAAAAEQPARRRGPGRPPGSRAANQAGQKKVGMKKATRKGRKRSAEARKRMSEAQKRRWAEQKKAES